MNLANHRRQITVQAHTDTEDSGYPNLQYADMTHLGMKSTHKIHKMFSSKTLIEKQFNLDNKILIAQPLTTSLAPGRIYVWLWCP